MEKCIVLDWLQHDLKLDRHPERIPSMFKLIDAINERTNNQSGEKDAVVLDGLNNKPVLPKKAPNWKIDILSILVSVTGNLASSCQGAR
jgi:hypothetical protein